MPTELPLPELGEGITEADVIRILVREGEPISVGQPLVTIETEKATVDVPADSAGTVLAVLVANGQTILPGQPLVSIDTGTTAAAAARPAPEVTSMTSTPTPTPAAPPAPIEASIDVEPAPTAAVATPPPALTPTATPTPTPTPTPVDGAPRAFAAPSVRRFAREIGVDVQRVPGSGPAGRIDVEDVKRFARERSDMSPTPARPSASEQPALPDFSAFGPVEREPLSRFRRTVARNMSTAWSQIPHVTLFATADLTALEAMRRTYRDAASKAGGTLTLSALLVKLVATALQQHPRLNSSLDTTSDELVLKHYYHIGLAVETERGLAVSVLRDVDQKDIIQLAVELRGIADRLKENALTIEEMRGASFTISSLETLGVSHFTPIVNWPEVAILGIGRDHDLPSYEDEELHSRRRLALSLSFDHRVIDGADGARFLRSLVNAMHDPSIIEPARDDGAEEPA